MSRPAHNQLEAHTAQLGREALRLERRLARETKKRQMPCQCQGGEYIFTQDGFEEIRDIYETIMESWRVERCEKQQVKMRERADNAAL